MRIHAIIPVVLLAGCTQEVMDDTPVGVSTEALNQTSSFRVGFRIANYYTLANPSPTLSALVLTPSASSTTTSAWSSWNSLDGFGDPSGMRIELVPDPDHTWGVSPSMVDFRLGIQARDDPSTEGLVEFTPWASEIGAFSTVPNAASGSSSKATKPYDHGFTSPGSYRIGVEVRLWQNLNRDLLDVAIGGQATGIIPGANCLFGCEATSDPLFTPWLRLQGGGWTHTIMAPTEGTTRVIPTVDKQIGIALVLAVSYQDHG